MNLIYINGDSHAAASECVTNHAWSEDDAKLPRSGRGPHPDNEAASFGAMFAEKLNIKRINQSQGGGSNDRIIRVTRNWIKENKNKLNQVFMIIQWSTWERTEWFYNNEWWQVNGSGTDYVPNELRDRYKQFIINIDWKSVTQRAHEQIWQFHNEINELNIPHLFFNGNNHFGGFYVENRLHLPIIPNHYDWGRCYIDPYSSKGTYSEILKSHGFSTVSPNSWHFGKDAHCFWADYMLAYIERNQLFR